MSARRRATRPAAIYTRLSLDRYGDGLGVERQLQGCTELADRLGLTVHDTYEDNNRSASTGKVRPDFARMMTDVDAGLIGTIIAWAPDRLTRHPREFQDFLESVESNSVDVHTIAAGSVDFSTPAGRANARVVSAFSILEGEQKAARQRAANDQRATQGRPPSGQVPFGYRRDPETGAYEIVPKEAKAVKWMVDAVLKGRSLSWIADKANADGVESRRGGQWGSGSISRLVKSPTNAALRVHRGEVLGEAAWDPIIDQETWRNVVAVLEDPQRKRSRPREDSYFLSGVLRCIDGTPLYGDRDGKGDGRRRIYRPKARNVDAFVVVDADKIEALIEELVLRTLDDASLIRTVAVASDEVKALHSDLAELEAARIADQITLAQFIAFKAPLEERIAAEEAKRVVVPHVPVLMATPGAARAAWPKLSTADKSAIVRSTIDHVKVDRATRGRHTPLADRIDPEVGAGDIAWKI